MDDVVPGVLQRLREADIVGLAGLAGASLGQEYCRHGYVSTTRRQGTHLSGVVILPVLSSENELTQADAGQFEEVNDLSAAVPAPVESFAVEVEVKSSNSCQVVCTCEKHVALICVHAATLLYQWINRPSTFIASPSMTEETENAPPTLSPMPTSLAKPAPARPDLPVRASAHPASRPALLSQRRPQVNTIGETLAQIGLSELRSIAREYGIGLTGLGKQQLIETLIETLSQPEAVRRVVASLEKPQRQLLAAFALAGGAMNDEDLRGLFERFSLHHAGTLQEMLVALQAKLLIVRTSFNHSLQPRLNFSLSPLDLNWYIPQEVREALHVTPPVTPFNVEVPYGKGSHPSLPTLHLAGSYSLLADLLLVARAMDGFPVEPSEKRTSRSGSLLPGNRLPVDGSLALPPPEDQPSSATIDVLRASLERSPAFLRFAVRLLRMADILYKEEGWQAHLRVLPNAAQLLLSSTRQTVLQELFTRWLGQVTYAELYELSENGMRVRCRATALNQPDLRRGELEQENNEARQEVLGLLAQIPVGEWINFSAFARFLYRLHPTFLQRRQRLFPSPHWWIEQEEGRPLHPAQLSDWLRAEGRYLASLIQGPLHWWGICDLAISTGEQLLAFRLTPLAPSLFHDHAPEIERVISPPARPALTVSPRGDLLIPCRADNWPLIACVEEFAESRGIQDEMLLYCLSASSLSEAMRQRRDPRKLLDLLDLSSASEDVSLHQLFESIERRVANYGHVRLYTDVSLLQTADTTVMQQLAAITSLDQQMVRPLSPTLLLLKKQGTERLLEELKRRGQVPLLHDEG